MSLSLAGRPTNLHVPPEAAASYVDSDLFNICERVKEISPALNIIVLHQGGQHAFAIMERGADGVDRLIFRVKQLDGRVLDRLREMLALPLNERLVKLEKDEYKHQEEREEEEFEQLYEKLGRPMWTQLEHDGFAQRGVSFPKRGVKANSGS